MITSSFFWSKALSKYTNAKPTFKELLKYIKGVCLTGRFKQRDNWILFIGFCVVNGYMFSQSLFTISQCFLSEHALSTGEIFRSLFGVLTSAAIFAFLRLTIPHGLMKLNVENNKIKMTVPQHIISTIIVCIPAVLFFMLFLFFNGYIA